VIGYIKYKMKKIIIISLVVIWYQLAHCLKLIKENKKKSTNL